MSEFFNFTKPNWSVVKDKKVYGTPIFSLHEISLQSEGKQIDHPFYILKAPEWINVIALTKENEIVLVEQYRAGTDAVTLEIPGGMVDDEEGSLEAAKRELVEETGYTSDNWEKIGRASSNPAILNNFTHLYVARDCEFSCSQKLDGTEDIKFHTVPFNDFLEMIRHGVVHHAIVLSAVAHYLLNESLSE